MRDIGWVIVSVIFGIVAVLSVVVLLVKFINQ